jgi:hypothetical protein
MAPKIRERIPSSLMGVSKAKGRTALFQEGFATSGKEFRSRQSVGRGLARYRWLRHVWPFASTEFKTYGDLAKLRNV